MRKIIHVDMDAFFAAIEQRDNPELRGKAIAVGGRPESRGVVSTASYEARKFGIHSAMPMATAVRKCPQLLIIPGRMAVYRQVAEHIRGIFARFTEKIEPLSIDEAYLDVSENNDFQGSATLLAQHIIETIFAETQLTASAGVSYCKFLAKYASDINKPNGVFTVTPAQALDIIAAMPVEKFHGIGPATQKKLNQLGIFTGLDLRRANRMKIQQQLGKSADFYYRLAHGQDEREVRVSRERKSIGNETTFASDISDAEAIREQLHDVLENTWSLLMRRDLFAMTLTVKIKHADFSLQTKSFTQTAPIYSLVSAEIIAEALLTQALAQRQDKGSSPAIRLVGVSFSQLVARGEYPLQRRLFD